MEWWGILLTCCGAVLVLGAVAFGLVMCLQGCRDYHRRCEAIYRGDDQLLAMVQRLPVEWSGVQESLKNFMNKMSAFDREAKKREVIAANPDAAALVALGGEPVQEDSPNGPEPAPVSKIERLGLLDMGRSKIG